MSITLPIFRTIVLVTAVLLSIMRGESRAASTLVVSGDLPIDLPQARYTDADGTFSAGVHPGVAGSVQVDFEPYDSTRSAWSLTFAVGPDEPLVQGTFVDAFFFDDEYPMLEVGGNGSTCGFAEGAFQVSEVAFDAGGELATLTVDFGLVCGESAMYGSLRFRSGDDACGGVADGTPCDDADACTSDDRCAAGRCAGVLKQCTPESECQEANVCDPIRGICLDPIFKPDETPCTPPERCSLGISEWTRARCLSGACQPTELRSCGRKDPCSIGVCREETGCVDHIYDGCWRLIGSSIVQLSASGTVRGQSVVCKTRCLENPDVVMHSGADGLVGLPVGSVQCGEEPVDLVALPTLTPHERKGFVLRHTKADRRRLTREMRECRRGRFLGLTGQIAVDAGGETLTGQMVVRQRIAGRQLPLSIRRTTKFNGVIGGLPDPERPRWATPFPHCELIEEIPCRLR